MKREETGLPLTREQLADLKSAKQVALTRKLLQGKISGLQLLKLGRKIDDPKGR